MRYSALLAAVFVALTAAADSAVVAVERFLKSHQPPQNSTCSFVSSYVVLDRWRNGSLRTVAATYLVDNECSTELAVLRVHAGGRLQKLASFFESPRAVELLDVTGNGVPEILVSQPPGRFAPVVILRWDGTELAEIGETSELATYVDLDHDGVLEIVEGAATEWNECGARAGATYVQKLRDGKFVTVGNPAPSNIFALSKTTGDPELFTVTPFLTNDRKLDGRVRIVNGTRGGRRRASKVELRVRRLTAENEEPRPGKLLPLHVSEHDEFVDGRMKLPSRCTLLDVTVYGPDGATIVIMMEGDPL